VVTGAATGIGFAVAEAFVAEGARVLLADIDGGASQAAADALGGDDTAIGVACDVRHTESVERMIATAVDRWGGVDVLVNNAGVGRSKLLQDTTDEEIDAILDVNVKGVVLCTRAVLPLMYAHGAGAVVSVGSQAGKRGAPEVSVYSASKMAVVGFTRALAVEAAPTVRINAICPGLVSTDMMARNIDDTAEKLGIEREQAEAQWLAPVPLGRMQTPQKVAGAVLFLASDAASEMTGEALNFSGGMVMH
jgi:NAD(P)-dependent dehydrogenase (short-subunit alcohol dehydrogenase family)